MLLDVLLLNPREVIFEGKAQSVILPGEQGVFEVRPFHKALLTRLIRGVLCIDANSFSIKRGIAKAAKNKVTIIIED